jgi:hypothetical protein
MILLSSKIKRRVVRCLAHGVISQKTKPFILVASVPSHTEVPLKTEAKILLAEYKQNCMQMAKARSDIEIVCKRLVIR